jgi:hypothetical protein
VILSPGVAQGARQSTQTCDSWSSLDAALYANLLSGRGTSARPPHVRACAKGLSSPAALANGSGAMRCSRSLAPGKPPSWLLTSCQVSNVRKAAEFAAALGLPLNRFITINWEAAGVSDGTLATGFFLKHARDWLRRRGRQFASVWVQERGHRVGQHVHMLVHLPPDLARRFSELQQGWLKACGAKRRRGTIKSRPVGRSYRSALLDSQTYRLNLKRVLAYILKQRRHPRLGGAARKAVARSLVLGKRCGTSENIGRLARSRTAILCSWPL